MDAQTIGMIVFFLLLGIFLFIKRKSITIDKIAFPLIYMFMFRTKLGLKTMDKMAKKFNKPLLYLGYFGIVIGFIGMVVIPVMLITNLYDVLFVPGAASGVTTVLPFEVKGAIFVPFFYYIICLIIIASIHEFAHGIVARAHGIKIKSSGFAFICFIIPIIPVAFVEPDEKQLTKSKRRAQLSVFAAGPLANILLGIICGLMLAFVFVPAMADMQAGVSVNSLILDAHNASPANASGIYSGSTIISLDGNPTQTTESFKQLMSAKKPGDTASVVLSDGTKHNVVLGTDPSNASKSFMGVSVFQKVEVTPVAKQKYGFFASWIIWLSGLFTWLVILNIGIGTFNLVPLGPIDGGRMLLTSLEWKLKKKNARQIWNAVSIALLLLIAVSILFALKPWEWFGLFR